MLNLGSNASPFQLQAPSSGEYWSRVVAAADLARLNPARSMDTEMRLTLAIATYMIRGKIWFSAEGGGPTLSARVTGPALTYGGLRRAWSGGSQDLVAFNPGYAVRVNVLDTADVNTPMNTGAPARAVALLEIEGILTPSAAGTFGVEWTGSSAAWAITRRLGSFIEYKRL